MKCRQGDRDLFLQWPKLKTVLACQPLSQLPTPVKPLVNMGVQQAWVKCDDISHPAYGGNKTRKLEFILPELLQNNIRHVVTLGGVGSNSAVAVAMMCDLHNIDCTVLVFDQPPTATVKKNLQLMVAYGAELVYTRSAVMAGLRYYLNRHRFDSTTAFIWAGCSNVRTVFSYVNAALELKKQIDNHECPMFDTLFVPVGSSSTVAGLTLGCALLGMPVVVKGVRVAPSHVGPIPACTPAAITGLMKAALEILADVYPEYQSFRLPGPVLLENYYGKDYGLSTPDADAAMLLAQEEMGIVLEQTYTGKTFAAFLDETQRHPGVHLFWNTHNSRDMEAVLQRCDIGKVPTVLRHYLQ